MMTRVGPFPFSKVLNLPIILILFTVFLATTSCLLPIFTFVLLSLLLLATMIIAMQVLEHNKTLELVPFHSRKKIVGCRWVYAIKVGLNDEVSCL